MKKVAPVLDVLFVLLFVGIGRSAHQHGITIAGMTSTTWPFGIGLLVGWGIVGRTHRSPTDLATGALIVLVTVPLAMVLRVVAGQGIALAFVLVALAFLALFLVGWRALVSFLTHRRGRGVPQRR